MSHKTSISYQDIEKITDFDGFVAKTVDPKFLKTFTTAHTFNETDQVGPFKFTMFE